jgi:hypothetical protein
MEEQVLAPMAAAGGHQRLLQRLSTYNGTRNDPAEYAALCFEFLDGEAERLHAVREAMIQHQVAVHTWSRKRVRHVFVRLFLSLCVLQGYVAGGFSPCVLARLGRRTASAWPSKRLH